MMEYVLLTVGKTHSGKTTFWKELMKEIKHGCIIDTDSITEFLKINYPDLYDPKYLNEIQPKDNIKWATFLEVYKHALFTSLPIILTNANTTKIIRKEIRTIAKEHKRKVIMIYFNRPEKILLNRITTTQRSKICLTKSRDFRDLLLNKQSKIFETPSEKEADIFFEIQSNKARKSIQKEIIDLIKNNKT